MNLKEIMLGSFEQLEKDKFPYYVQLHCLMNDALNVPKEIREQFPEHIMFVLSSDLQSNVFYDYTTKYLSFDCRFNGVYCRVVAHTDCIIAITDNVTQCQFAINQKNIIKKDETVVKKTKPEVKQNLKSVEPSKQKNLTKKTSKPPHLYLVK